MHREADEAHREADEAEEEPAVPHATGGLR
jgi:hypothetical protein